MNNQETREDNGAVTGQKPQRSIVNRCIDLYHYLWSGIWQDTRNTVGVRVLKILNLSVRTFLNKDLQSRSMALTYSTVLALVPALALVFAIGRGFGFQNLLQSSIYAYFPSQHQAIETALSFVDSYLKEASQGVFVGVGIVFLLWTLISLMSNIEMSFNQIWDIRNQRSLYRKVTDYTAICLIVPIMMVCSSGASIFMSSTITGRFAFLTPLVSGLLDFAPFLLAVIAFTLSFMLIPNTKVQFKYALLAGFVSGVGFAVLQWLFVNGQIYVSKYNAIYGSFSFLPLLLIWLQLSWLILLFGCLLAFSAQNVMGFNYTDSITDISENYLRGIAVTVMAIIVRQHRRRLTPLSVTQISANYGLPVRLVTLIVDKLRSAELTYLVMNSDGSDGIAPAVDTAAFSVADLLHTLDMEGKSNFIPNYGMRYASLLHEIKTLLDAPYSEGDKILLKDLPLPESVGLK